MEYLLTFEQFVKKLNNHEINESKKKQVIRNKELAGLQESKIFRNQYAIQILIDSPNVNEIILEHEQYKRFKKTKNLYTYHPEDSSIPVKAHFHIFPSNSKDELYSVYVETGKAHHKKNRGYQIPKKEAEELRSLGVQIHKNNILESVKFTLNEDNYDNYLTFFLIIDEE